MEEIITVDGRTLRLTTDHQLTESEKMQAIADIRNGNMPNLGVISLQNQACASINMLQPPTAADVSVVDITVGGVDCGAPGPCPTDLTCTNAGCVPPDAIPVVVTFSNSGTADVPITPILTINGADSGIFPNEGSTITVPAGTTAIATYAGLTLVSGPNSVCVNW